MKVIIDNSGDQPKMPTTEINMCEYQMYTHSDGVHTGYCLVSDRPVYDTRATTGTTLNVISGKYCYDVKKYENMSSMQRELCSSEVLQKSMMVCLNKEELDMMDDMKMRDVKDAVLRNYVIPDNIGNKRWKKTWIKALIKSREWGFNTFAVGVKGSKKNQDGGINFLKGQVDVLLMIQKFM